MKAIETEYSGCRFRSRTEARWAVFFDHLGWRWQFEPEGFELKAGRYLPDFKVWTHRRDAPTWFEVKPFKDGCPDDERWSELAQESGTRILIAYGMHRSGDGCESAWAKGKAEPHAGRVHLPSGKRYRLGPFWTEPGFTEAWDAASGARFEFGQSGARSGGKSDER